MQEAREDSCSLSERGSGTRREQAARARPVQGGSGAGAGRGPEDMSCRHRGPHHRAALERGRAGAGEEASTANGGGCATARAGENEAKRA